MLLCIGVLLVHLRATNFPEKFPKAYMGKHQCTEALMLREYRDLQPFTYFASFTVSGTASVLFLEILVLDFKKNNIYSFIDFSKTLLALQYIH